MNNISYSQGIVLWWTAFMTVTPISGETRNMETPRDFVIVPKAVISSVNFHW